jgi:hypothetical protein
MSQKRYWVEINVRKPRRKRPVCVFREGPFPSRAKAEARRQSHIAAPPLPRCSVWVVIDRSEYWAHYHKKRYRNDPAYRERHLVAARAAWERRRRLQQGDFAAYV